ncbi:MAG TPA: AAA family ATPase [Candidatus Diapherotrites archaeon]|uniref:AAA family ATPase n=2 Tax=Candidatus Iainarchaeum sp. TaxID=3101447 RepID=A0A7J4JPE3_9ARCH|nr:AAA family ATPase [Candidatus Diapherotrites archaeon]
MDTMLIGLTGRNCAGKGTVAEHLKAKSFGYASLSDVIRDELKARGQSESRDAMIGLGNELREKFGPAVLAERILPRLKKDSNWVIDSIRNPAEVSALKAAGNFHLLWIEAPTEVRFKRALDRKRTGDSKTLAEFRKAEEREARNADASAQQLDALRGMADVEVVNDGSLEHLYKNADATIAGLPQNFERPSWDEYFIHIAREVSSRSNCVKRKIGAVIVKDKRLISTGYNGTPRGVRNCNEGGCPRCNSFAKSGTNLEECVCSHAEENAIVQASYHGVELKGSTLYTTMSPCLQCAKMAINAGIAKVVYNVEYAVSETAKRILQEAGVELVQAHVK